MGPGFVTVRDSLLLEMPFANLANLDESVCRAGSGINRHE